MSNPYDLTQLIVCSDERAGELACVLKHAGTVYRRRSKDRKTWTFSLFDHSLDSWAAVADDKVPKLFDVLFFHTGERDPAGIPADSSFPKEFAFSTGHLPTEGPYGGRESAIAIRRFLAGHCPVKKRHLPELNDFLKGTRPELPNFCRRDETVPALWSLAILVQGYAAAAIANGEISGDSPFVGALGWNSLNAASRSRLAGRLVRVWIRMNTVDWWRASLGISDDNGKTLSAIRYQAFLVQLIKDLELQVLIGHELGLRTETDLSTQPAVTLLPLLKKHNGPKMLDFLEGSLVDVETVENIYMEVKSFLEQR